MRFACDSSIQFYGTSRKISPAAPTFVRDSTWLRPVGTLLQHVDVTQERLVCAVARGLVPGRYERRIHGHAHFLCKLHAMDGTRQ